MALSGTEAYWLLGGLGLSVEMEAFGSAFILMFCGAGSSLVASKVLELSLLHLGFRPDLFQ